jgi:protein associated with RNAse G/E
LRKKNTYNPLFYLWLPKIHYIYFYLDLPIPRKQKVNITDSDCHYWEVNKIGYSKKRILSILKKHFKLKKYYRIKFNPYHFLIVLEK